MNLFLTAPADSGFSMESIKKLMDNFDPAELLPEISTITGKTALICRVSILAGPILLLAMGLAYLLLSPREANHYFGYRTYFGMGSVAAWRFTQRLAGVCLSASGLVLTLIMLLNAGSFGGMQEMDMVWKAVRCLCWEAGTALLVIAIINSVIALTFNSKGERRHK